MKDWPQHKIETKKEEAQPDEKKQDRLMVRSTPIFKLRTKEGKNIQGINLAQQFGFSPQVLIFERLLEGKNEFVVRAIIPESELKKIKKAENKK